MAETLTVRGAREHNLKNVDLELPRERLIVFTGISGGASFGTAIQVAEKAEPGSVILAMLPDTGERYLSTPLFEGIETGSDAV